MNLKETDNNSRPFIDLRLRLNSSNQSLPFSIKGLKLFVFVRFINLNQNIQIFHRRRPFFFKENVFFRVGLKLSDSSVYLAEPRPFAQFVMCFARNQNDFESHQSIKLKLVLDFDFYFHFFFIFIYNFFLI